jgi:hypothetical protein
MRLVSGLVIGLVIASLAEARVAAADPEVENVELDAVSSSPCADAIAQLDPQGEVKPAPACKQLQRLAVNGLGTVALKRVVTSDAAIAGYVLVLSVEQPAGTRWKALWFSSGGCGAGTCVDYKPRSARLVRIDPTGVPNGDPAFGVEIESMVEVSHTFKDMGPAVTTAEHFRLACSARARVLDCKQMVLGGRGPDCRALGWHGTAVRYRCTGEAQLVPARSDDTAGIPQADVERMYTLMQHVDRVIADNFADCASLASQLDKLVARDAELFTLARGLASPAAALPAPFARELQHSVSRLIGAQTCALNVPVQDALGRTFHALGLKADFHLAPKP